MGGGPCGPAGAGQGMSAREGAQMDLPLSGRTKCGYCLRELEQLDWRPGWSCPRCAPILRDLPISGFAQFTKEAARAR